MDHDEFLKQLAIDKNLSFNRNEQIVHGLYQGYLVSIQGLSEFCLRIRFCVDKDGQGLTEGQANSICQISSADHFILEGRQFALDTKKGLTPEQSMENFNFVLNEAVRFFSAEGFYSVCEQCASDYGAAKATGYAQWLV